MLQCSLERVFRVCGQASNHPGGSGQNRALGERCATLTALEKLVDAGFISEGEGVVLFNAGVGWLYR
jgi:hypothetical protein